MSSSACLPCPGHCWHAAPAAPRGATTCPDPFAPDCHPRSQGVPVTFQGHEGPVPSAPAALRGPVLVLLPVLPRFVLSSLVLPFPRALLGYPLCLPSSGQVPHKQEVPVTAQVCGVPGPWRAVPALPGHAGSMQQCYRPARAVSALSEQSWAQLLPQLCSWDLCPALPALPPPSLPRPWAWQH